MRENQYQSRLIRRLREEFPGCFILKNDSSYLQGVPDLLVLFGRRWAMLEVKASRVSAIQPNQEHYVAMLDEMSFAAFIYPEIEDEVFNALQPALSPHGESRAPQR